MSVEVDKKVSKKKRLSVLKFLSALCVALLLGAFFIVPQGSEAEAADGGTGGYYVDSNSQKLFYVKDEKGNIASNWSFCVEPAVGNPSGSNDYTKYDNLDAKFFGSTNESRNTRYPNALDVTKKALYEYALDNVNPSALNEAYKAAYGEDLQLTGFTRWVVFRFIIDHWGDKEDHTRLANISSNGPKAQQQKLLTLLTGRKDSDMNVTTVTSESVLGKITSIPADAKFIYLQKLNGASRQDTAYVELPKNPEITTSVTEKGKTNDQSLPYNGGAVTDTVNYKRLKPNQPYTLVGNLVDKDTQQVIPGTTRTKTFTPDAAEGSTTLDIPVPSGYAGKNLVVYEKLYDGDLTNGSDSDTSKITDQKPVATHEKIDAASQTFNVEVGPSIGTKAVNVDKAADDQNLLPAAGGKIKDTVNYSNLQPNTQYTVAGTLKVQNGSETGLATNINGITTFRTGEANNAKGLVDGSVDVFFTVPSNYVGKTLVAFEKLYTDNLTNGSDTDISKTNGKESIATHEDIKDPNQSVSIDGPKILTSAAKKDSPEMKELPIAGGVVTDTVTYSNLKPNTKYTLVGKLMEKGGDDPNNPTVGETKITGFTTFTTDSVGVLVKGTQTVDFTVPGTYSGKTLVAYEDLYEGEIANGQVPEGTNPVAVHKDIKDAKQTVTVQAPTMTTLAQDAADGDNTIDSNGGTVTDNVYYSGLVPNTTYTLDGKLVVKNDSSEVTGTRHLGTFTTGAADAGKETASGTATMKFTVPQGYAGKDLVAFEKLYSGDLTVPGNANDFSKLNGQNATVTHEDINDAKQTVSVTQNKPDLKTVATDNDGDKLVNVGGGNSTIKDRVYYSGLNPNTTYKLVATPRYGKEYGSKAGERWGGNWGPSGEKIFQTDATGNGFVDVQISNIGKGWGDKDKSIVIYEELYLGNTKVTDHSNLDDVDQTVKFVDNPKTVGLKTLATTDDKTTGKNWEVTGGQSVITDKVTYTGLLTNTDYIIRGEVMVYDPTTKQVTPTGITADSGKFRPANANGDKSLQLDVTSIFEKYVGTGKNLVVYERLYRAADNVQVADHTDPTDLDQTVYPVKPTVSTNASVDSVTNNVLTMKDAFTYKGLADGHLYHLTAQAVATDANGAQKVVGQAEKDFTASGVTGNDSAPIQVANYDTITGPIKVIVKITRTDSKNGQVFYFGELASHNTELNDVREQVYRLTTKAEFTYANGATSGTPTGIKDTVTIYGLNGQPTTTDSKEAVSYYLSTSLVAKDNPSNVLVAPVKTDIDPAKPSSSTNQWTVSLPDKVTNGEAVVYQELHRVIGNEDTLVGIHKDIKDANQTLKKTDVTTLKFRLEKVNKFGDGQTLLKDAEFELHADENNSMKSDTLQKFVSDGQGHYDVSNLAPGKYWLLETKAPSSGAPAGQFMQLLPSPVQFEIKQENGKAVIVPLINATGFLIEKGTDASDSTQALGQVADVSVGDMPKAGDDKMIPLMLLSMSTILAGLAVAFRNTKKTKRR